MNPARKLDNQKECYSFRVFYYYYPHMGIKEGLVNLHGFIL